MGGQKSAMGEGWDCLLAVKIQHRKGSLIEALPETGASPRVFSWMSLLLLLLYLLCTGMKGHKVR